MLPRCPPAAVRPGRCTANLLLPPALDLGGLVAQKSRDLKVMPPNNAVTGNSPLQNKAGSATAVVGDRSLSELRPQRPRCDRKYIQTNVAIPIVIRAAGKGGGVLDRPAEKVSPGRKSEFDVKKSRKMSPPFRVVLHNDNENRREYVVQVLMKVIPGMTVDNAVNIMQEAHVNGMAVVIVCSQPEAEEHCTALRGNGLRSSIEPSSGGC